MKKELLVITMLGSLLIAPTVLATEEKPVAKSESTVTFSPDDNTGIIDPTDPDGGGEIIDGESDGNAGDGSPSFNIVWVSNFRFYDKDTDGKAIPIPLNANGMNLWSKGTKLTYEKETGNKVAHEDIPNFIQVADNRGTLTGWNLKVSGTPFVGTKGDSAEKPELKGATLSLNHPHLSGPNGVSGPTIFANTLNIGTAPVSVMKAIEGSGVGNWSLYFGARDNKTNKLIDGTGVNLDIPASAGIKAGFEYKSELTWTLEDTPAD